MMLWTAGAVQAGAGLAWGLALSIVAEQHHDSSIALC